MPPAVASAIPGRDRKSEWTKLSGKVRGVGRLRSTCEASNKADQHSVTESVEGRRPVGRKVSGETRPGHRAGPGVSPKPRVCEPAGQNVPCRLRSNSRQEPTAGKPHGGICAGGARATRFPTATQNSSVPRIRAQNSPRRRTHDPHPVAESDFFRRSKAGMTRSCADPGNHQMPVNEYSDAFAAPLIDRTAADALLFRRRCGQYWTA